MTYHKLSNLLPLSAPFTLMVDPTNVCNFKCTFCPTGDPELLKSVNRLQGMMDLGLFQKIVDDLAELPAQVTSLRLYKDGEPFANKNIVEMIRYAKEKQVAKEIYTISNGSLINKKMAEAILNAGLDNLRVSVEHIHEKGYKRVTQNYTNYERIVANMKYLFELKTAQNKTLHINAKLLNTGLSVHEIEQFHKTFAPISDSVSIETLMGWSHSEVKDFTLGHDVTNGIDGASPISEERKVCPEPFKGLAVNFDGTVSVCCVDWSHQTVVGDLNKDRFLDIWNGEKFKQFRLLHLRNERHKIPPCANCHYMKGRTPLSDLDNHAKDLVNVYN